MEGSIFVGAPMRLNRGLTTVCAGFFVAVSVAMQSPSAAALNHSQYERLNRASAHRIAERHKREHRERVSGTWQSASTVRRHRIYLHRNLSISRLFTTPYGYVAVGRIAKTPILPMKITTAKQAPAQMATAPSPPVSPSFDIAPYVATQPGTVAPSGMTTTPIGPGLTTLTGPSIIFPPDYYPYGFPVEPYVSFPPVVHEMGPNFGGQHQTPIISTP